MHCEGYLSCTGRYRETHSLFQGRYFTEATVLTGKEQLCFYTLKTSTEVRLKKVHLHWWNYPPPNDIPRNKGKFQSIWKGRIHFPCYVLDTHIDWMSRERRTKVACAKIVPCSAGNQNSLAAKASEAISRVAQPAQLGAPLVFPNSLCQRELLCNMRYSNTDKNVMDV